MKPFTIFRLDMHTMLSSIMADGHDLQSSDNNSISDLNNVTYQPFVQAYLH